MSAQTVTVENQNAHINFRKIDSKLIKKAFYNEEKKELAIKYHKGDMYIFSEVPKEIYEELYVVPSPGKHLLHYVHHYKVKWKKINTKTSRLAALLVLMLNRFC